MKIDNPNMLLEYGSSIREIKVESNEIIIETKNGATLTIKPVFNEENEMSYDMNLLTSKENKAIKKNLEKIEKLRREIEETMSGGVETHDEESEENEEYDSVMQGLQEAAEHDENLM